MNYQHLYHAGNTADVVKHSVMVLLLQYLQNKPTPYCYLDTHAGAGCYDLLSTAAQKTGEAAQGVLRLLQATAPWPVELQRYREIITDPRYQGSDGRLRYYPGSAEIAAQVKRSQDRLIVNELNPPIVEQLRAHFGRRKDVAIHARDAYEFWPALVPPAEKRGLVLVDPAFETQTEWQGLRKALHKSLERWPQEIVMIWAPITGTLRSSNDQQLLRGLAAPVLQIEFTVADTVNTIAGLTGSRLLIINPPYQFESSVRKVLQYLWSQLKIAGGGYQIRTMS